MTTKPKYKVRKFNLRSYDVWGNADDGYTVNDVYNQGTVSIRCKRADYNVGTEHEFSDYAPTDRQLSRAAGVTRCDWDGDGAHFYANADDGMPVCELIETE